MIDELVVVSNDRLAVALRPSVGCEIVELTDARTGIQLLGSTPWGRPPHGQTGWAQTSEDYWLRHTSGGWNLLLPHAGAQRDHAGGVSPFHGEAGIIAWEVLAAEGDRARFRTTLLGSPLEVDREVAVDGLEVVVTDTVINRSPDAVRIAWGHHPTFGEPFIAPGVRIEVEAGDVTVEASPTTGRWPLLDGVDLSVVPDQPRALLAYLAAADGRYRIVNDALGLGVELTWPAELFPYLWLWQELRATPGYPWFRRMYAMALEPQSAIPQGAEPTVPLEGGAQLAATVSARLFHP